MRKGKKVAAAVAGMVLCICMLFGKVYAAESQWKIEHTLDKESCTQGDTLQLSVSLKGESKSKTTEITTLSGILEYDTSLFSVGKEDILPSGKETVKECTFDAAAGKFTIVYNSKISAKDADELLQIRLHVAEDSSVGKTTVCVTNMEWSGADGKEKQEMEHRVPAHITIQPSKSTAPGDVNGDGKVDLVDAKLVMQYYNGEDVLDEVQQKNADTNGDGLINLIDVKQIMQYYNGEIDGFVTGQTGTSVT